MNNVISLKEQSLKGSAASAKSQLDGAVPTAAYQAKARIYHNKTVRAKAEKSCQRHGIRWM